MNTYCLGISRMEVRLNKNATESYKKECERNETECKRNETDANATKRQRDETKQTLRERSSTQTQQNANGNCVERKRNSNFTCAFIDLVSFKYM